MNQDLLPVDLYTRVSDDKEGEQVGVKNQETELRAWCEQRGWRVVTVYSDPSVSATSGERRPGFEGLLERSEHRPVVVWSTDRLARVSKDMERVLETKMTVYALHAGGLDLSTIQGQAMARIVTAMATAEVQTKNARARMANASRAAKGVPYWKRAPFGHTVHGKVVEEEADLIRTATAEILSGGSLGSVAREWREKDVRTPQGAKAWAAWRVRDVLLAPRLAGILTYKGERQPVSTIEPIITEEDHLALVGILTAPGRGKGGGPTANLLTGIALCGICDDGTTVVGTTKSTRRGNVLTYRCSKFGHCHAVRDDVDFYVMTRTLQVLTDPDAAPLLVESVDTKDAAIEAGRLRAELAEWETAAPSLGAAEYLRITTPLKVRLEAAEDVLRTSDRGAVFAGLVDPQGDGWLTVLNVVVAAGIWETLSLARQRAIVSATWDRVALLPRPSTARGFLPEYVALER